MSFLHAHKSWISLLALAFVIIAARGPALHFAGDRAAKGYASLQAACAKTENNLKQLRDDAAAARKLSGEIDRTHADQLLAPTDRLKAALLLEREASTAKIARFTYTLAPEERLTVDAGGAAQNLAKCPITLAGDAPADTQIYGFLMQIQRLLPGRARLQQLSVERTAKADAPLTGVNVHFEATLEWLSNGTLQTVAGRL